MGALVRFSADQTEVASLIRRMMHTRNRHAAPIERGCAILMVPLAAEKRDDLRFRRTATPLLRRLADDDAATVWGIYVGDEKTPPPASALPHTAHAYCDPKTKRFTVDAEKAGMIVLQLGPAQGADRRREGLLIATDATRLVLPDLPPEVQPIAQTSARFGRDLVERCARRMRRRGEWRDGRFFVPREP